MINYCKFCNYQNLINNADDTYDCHKCNLTCKIINGEMKVIALRSSYDGNHISIVAHFKNKITTYECSNFLGTNNVFIKINRLLKLDPNKFWEIQKTIIEIDKKIKIFK